MYRQRTIHKLLLACTCCLLVACNTTKHVPDGAYLLNKTGVAVDVKEVKAVELEALIRQKANSAAIRVWLYNVGDTTNWLRRLIRKAGEPPVVYDPQSTTRSTREIRTEMENKGFLNAEVTARIDTAARKKLNVTYVVTPNEPYRIRNYNVDIPEKHATSMLRRRRFMQRSKIKEGIVFDVSVLEKERQKINSLFHNAGYYGLEANNLHFLADTALNTHQVDLTLTLQDSTNFRPYRIRNVNVWSGYDPMSNRHFMATDSTVFRDLNILYDDTHFIRPHVLYDNTDIRPGQTYSEQLSEETYNLLSALSAVSKAGIEYREVASNDSATAFLDCNIYVAPGNIHGIQMGLDGTNNAGDLGIAGNVSYTHNNIFNGSEMLNIKLKGAYEFIDGNSEANLLAHNYYEVGIGTTLTFPKIIFPFVGHKIKKLFKANTQFGLSLDVQNRPEYTRDFFNLSWKYKWESLKGLLQHNLNVLDVNFVSMPYKSATFDEYINTANNYLTKVSYDNVFTAGIGYNGSYTTAGKSRYRSSLYTLRYGVELSGNLLHAIYNLADASKNEDGQYQLLSNPFAQYVKADFDYSQTYRLTEKNAIAIHGALGMAYPYGNSTILPFEKRYYTGGPNSVRGWNTRQLGPGTYSASHDFSTQTGDLKILLNAEYRYKLIPLLEIAGFVDAGNVWTIRNYPNQQGGQFHWHSFYQELAMATGVGLRLDLSFLIIRIDAGKKLYDPLLKNDNPWVITNKFKGNTALHFAIGYPF